MWPAVVLGNHHGQRRRLGIVLPVDLGVYEQHLANVCAFHEVLLVPRLHGFCDGWEINQDRSIERALHRQDSPPLSVRQPLELDIGATILNGYADHAVLVRLVKILGVLTRKHAENELLLYDRIMFPVLIFRVVSLAFRGASESRLCGSASTQYSAWRLASCQRLESRWTFSARASAASWPVGEMPRAISSSLSPPSLARFLAVGFETRPFWVLMMAADIGGAGRLGTPPAGVGGCDRFNTILVLPVGAGSRRVRYRRGGHGCGRRGDGAV